MDRCIRETLLVFTFPWREAKILIFMDWLVERRLAYVIRQHSGAYGGDPLTTLDTGFYASKPKARDYFGDHQSEEVSGNLY